MTGVVACILLVLAAADPVPAAGTPAGQGLEASRAAAAEQALRHYVQGRLHEERGELERALTEYYRALLLDPRAADVARRVSELAARSGDAERARAFADRALTLEPGHPRALWLKGTALFNRGRAAESLPVLEQAAAADSSDAEILRTLARVAEHLDRVDLVERANTRVVAIEEEDGESWFQLSTARARLQDFAGAERALTRAAALNPRRPGLLFMKGWVREGLGHPAEAIDFYRDHLRLHPGDHVTRRRLVNLLAIEKRYADAYDEVRVLAAGQPRDLSVLEVEADLAFQVGRAAEALRATSRMRELAGDDVDGQARVAAVLIRRGRAGEAHALADAWAARRPADCRGPVLQARTRALAGERERAASFAGRAVEACPDSLAPRVLLARLHQEAGDWAAAERAWAEAARRFPDHVGVALDLAYSREQRGDVAGAQAAARDILTRHPQNPTVLNFLGYLLADHNRDLEEARGMIERALQQDPDNGAFIDSLGWVYYRLGRLAEARRELERAVEMTRGDPVVHEHLGDVYKDLQLIDLARDQYRKSLARDAGNQRVRDKLERLR